MSQTRFCCECDSRTVYQPFQPLEDIYGAGSTLWLCGYHAKKLTEELAEMNKPGTLVMLDESPSKLGTTFTWVLIRTVIVLAVFAAGIQIGRVL